MNTKRNTINYAIIIASIILVAVVGSIFVNMGMDWFNLLKKPSAWIPNFVIPLVWTIIYVLCGVIMSIIYSKQNFSAQTKILLILNGILNVVWCGIFFALKQMFLGNVVIIFNLVMSYLLIVDIYENYKKTFGLILSVYPLWISIATTLNLALWILN